MYLGACNRLLRENRLTFTCCRRLRLTPSGRFALLFINERYAREFAASHVSLSLADGVESRAIAMCTHICVRAAHKIKTLGQLFGCLQAECMRRKVNNARAELSLRPTLLGEPPAERVRVQFRKFASQIVAVNRTTAVERQHLSHCLVSLPIALATFPFNARCSGIRLERVDAHADYNPNRFGDLFI